MLTLACVPPPTFAEKHCPIRFGSIFLVRPWKVPKCDKLLIGLYQCTLNCFRMVSYIMMHIAFLSYDCFLYSTTSFIAGNCFFPKCSSEWVDLIMPVWGCSVCMVCRVCIYQILLSDRTSIQVYNYNCFLDDNEKPFFENTSTQSLIGPKHNIPNINIAANNYLLCKDIVE